MYMFIQFFSQKTRQGFKRGEKRGGWSAVTTACKSRWGTAQTIAFMSWSSARAQRCWACADNLGDSINLWLVFSPLSMILVQSYFVKCLSFSLTFQRGVEETRHPTTDVSQTIYLLQCPKHVCAFITTRLYHRLYLLPSAGLLFFLSNHCFLYIFVHFLTWAAATLSEPINK